MLPHPFRAVRERVGTKDSSAMKTLRSSFREIPRALSLPLRSLSEAPDPLRFSKGGYLVT